MLNKYIKEEGKVRVPEWLYLVITEHCPLKCEQCYNNGKILTEMSYNIYEDNINQADHMGIKKVVLIGGEPLVYPSIRKGLKLLMEKNMYCTISTSGYGIEKIIDILKKYQCIWLNISLNGSTETINDKSRDGFTYAVNAMKLLKKNNIQYSVNWVARHSNVDNFLDLLDFIFSFGANYINILQTKKDYLGIEKDNITEKDFWKLKKYILNSKYKDRIKADRCCIKFSQELLGIKVPKYGYGCTAGEYIICVDTQGRYQPCQHLPLYSNEISLQETWNKSELFQSIRKDKKPCICDCTW